MRRLLGLYTFFYVALHLTIFLWLDYLLDPQLIVEALFAKRYALIGLVAFLIMLPLAITSTRSAMRRMGKRWKTLHKWVYVAGVLAVLHYLLLGPPGRVGKGYAVHGVGYGSVGFKSCWGLGESAGLDGRK